MVPRWAWVGAGLALAALSVLAGEKPARPNILLAIADDWGYGHAGAYACKWIKTPGFDRVAQSGILFTHAYTPNAKCAPSRACLLTGRNSWQLKAGCNHIPYFPPEFKTYAEALSEHGYFVGLTAKGWAPGVATNALGQPRQMAGQPFNRRTAPPPAQGIHNNDYAANFADFLAAAPPDRPWCFWYGALEPHRAYEYGSGVAKGGKKLADVDRVPGYWPDNDIVRHDLLDYAFEVEHFDRHLVRMLGLLEERGALENTLVVVTSDHGMPFPRAKGQEYDFSNRVPLAMMWPRGIRSPGRTVDDYVSFIDLAPTFLELAGLSWAQTGMAPAAGRSLTEIFQAARGGQVVARRDHVLIGKERHDVGRPNDWGYPIRGIVKGETLYLRNFEPARWPAGNPETGYLNCDGGATKTLILQAHRQDPADRFWALCFGKRGAEELYDLAKDPDCLTNLVDRSEHQARKAQLQQQLFAELKAQGDPRMFDQGQIFEQYPYANPGQRNFYERFMRGEKIVAGWVSKTDFEPVAQTDQRPPALLTNVSRELTLDQRYLNLPVKNGAPKRLVSLKVGGRTAQEFEIELAEAQADWWAFLDVSAFRGEKAVLQVDKLPENSAALRSIETSRRIKDAERVYQETLRPQFHFSARRGWNNDPNGLVFHEGEYHLFFQHNPYGWNWGNMHWGHAVSRDLVHWQELDEALYPDELGTMFSGSAVVDVLNTAGFAQGREKAIVCIYTAAGGTSRLSQGRPFSQCLAYSTDRGRTWTKYEKNPVLPHLVGSNRDPKVIWYAPEKKWIMALYLDKSDFALFGSPDLKRWDRLCDVSLPGTSECPEFFEMAVDGDAKNPRWIFYGGNGRYLVGRFDGRNFTSESSPHALNFGNCFYASQTFNQLPAEDGRRILIAWGQINFPGMPFNQMMDFPVELTLRTTEEGLRLFANPVREIAALHARSDHLKPQTLTPGENPLAQITGELLDLTAELAPGDAAEIGLKIRGTAITYDVKKSELACLSKKALLRPAGGKIRLRLLVDRGSIEIFGNGGRLYMPMGVILPAENRALEISVKGEGARLEAFEAHALRSVWQTAPSIPTRP